MQTFHYGVVEDRNDPLKLGRYRVRVAGIHTSDKVSLPTEHLPWAVSVQPTTSAGVSGVGSNPGLVCGSWVLVVFTSDDLQIPIILGSIAGIPAKPGTTSNESPTEEKTTSNGGETKLPENTTSNVVDGSGNPISTGSGGSLVTSTPVDTNDISLIPTAPPGGSSDPAKAKLGIEAIIRACVNGGITNRNAICAILGIAGGESGWIPQKESHKYTDLSRVFPKVTAEQNAMYSRLSGKTR